MSAQMARSGRPFATLHLQQPQQRPRPRTRRGTSEASALQSVRKPLCLPPAAAHAATQAAKACSFRPLGSRPRISGLSGSLPTRNSGVETAAGGCCQTFHGGTYGAVHRGFASHVIGVGKTFGYTFCHKTLGRSHDRLYCGAALFGACLR